MQAQLISKTFGLAATEVAGHLFGRLRLTIDAGEAGWSVLTFTSQLDAEAAQALLSAQRIYSLRTEERVGSRIWIRWSEAPDPGVTRGFFERLLGRELAYRLAVEGPTLAPLHSGGSIVGPDQKAANFLPRGPRNRLGVLARKML
jgi:hypothetical protein